jgi:hypothetical protein
VTRAQNGERDPLEKPWNRRLLQEDLAKSGKTQAELARKYGVSGPAITKFKQRHKAVIEEIRENAADKFAGIALAKQQARLELYQQMIDDAEERGDHKLSARIARQMAEELGHLPGRVTLAGEVGTTTKYTIEGVSQEDLT